MNSSETARKNTARGWVALVGGIVVLIIGIISFFILIQASESSEGDTWSYVLLVICLIIAVVLMVVGGYLISDANRFNRELDKIALSTKARGLEYGPGLASGTPRFCPSCGAEIRQTTPFCPMCGKKL